MIIRVKKGQDPYARIDKVPINDKRLTWKARGVLLYLLSKPDDWQVIIQDLINQSPQGETVIKSVIRELKKHNYLKSVILRENGKITGHEYQVYERPIETPLGGKPAEREIQPAENQGRLILEEALTNEKTEKSKDMQRDKTAPPSPKKRRSLKDCSRADVIAIYEQDPTTPPKGLARPQILAAILDHTEGFDDIIAEKGWSTIMMRLGQMFNGHRKVSLEYRDLVGAAIDLDRIPKPPHQQRSLDYLIGALTGQTQERRARRFEDEAQGHKMLEEENRLLSNLANHVRLESA